MTKTELEQLRELLTKLFNMKKNAKKDFGYDKDIEEVMKYVDTFLSK
jgi:hypothetical protein